MPVLKKVIIIITVVALMIIVGFLFLLLGTNLFAYPTFAQQEEINLIIEGNNINYNVAPVIIGEQIMVPADILIDYFDINTTWEKERNNIIITDFQRVIRMKGQQDWAKINSNIITLSHAPIFIEDMPLIPIRDIQNYFYIDSTMAEETNTVILASTRKTKNLIKISSEVTRVRMGLSLWEKVVDMVLKDDIVEFYYTDNSEWLKIVTPRGIIGYIKKEQGEILQISKSIEEPVEIDPIYNQKINLTWDQIYSPNYSTENIPDMEGLNVISPTWFHIINGNGDIKSLASYGYVEWARNRGYKIWGLFSNNFDLEITTQVLNNSDIREKVILDVLDLHLMYNLDGINIDFENVYLRDRDVLTQFVRELSPMFREKGLIVSIDVTVRGGSDTWSKCYDRKALGQVVDYVALMTYDEHWAASPISGSVASIGWVERGLIGLLEEVPNHKLLLGIPFYTRLWEETKDSQGNIKVSSRAYSMSRIKNILEQNKADLTWSEENGQYYGEYRKGNSTFKVWVEDEKSIGLKTQLIRKYNLGGVASWSRGFEKPEVWSVIKENLQ